MEIIHKRAKVERLKEVLTWDQNRVLGVKVHKINKTLKYQKYQDHLALRGQLNCKKQAHA